MKRIRIQLVSTALSKPETEKDKQAEVVEIPFLREIRIRQKALKPVSFSAEKVKVE